MSLSSTAADILIHVATPLIDSPLKRPGLALVQRFVPKASDAIAAASLEALAKIDLKEVKAFTTHKSDSVAASALCVLFKADPALEAFNEYTDSTVRFVLASSVWLKRVKPLLDTDYEKSVFQLRQACLTPALAANATNILTDMAEDQANAGGLAAANDTLLYSLKFLRGKPDSDAKTNAVTILSDAVQAINLAALERANRNPLSAHALMPTIVAQAHRLLAPEYGLPASVAQNIVPGVINHLGDHEQWQAAERLAYNIARVTGETAAVQLWGDVVSKGAQRNPVWARGVMEDVADLPAFALSDMAKQLLTAPLKLAA